MSLVHYDLEDAKYHGDPALGSTGAKQLLVSPEKFRHRQEHGFTTKALAFGRLFHALTLEPEKPHRFVAKDWDGRTTAGKARAAEVAEQKLEIVTDDEWDQAHKMAEAVRRRAGHLLTVGRPEVSAFADLDGVPCKARADWIRDDGIIVDLKSTASSAHPSETGRTAAKYGYYISAAWYLDVFAAAGVDIRGFLLIFIEKDEPHLVSVGELDEDALALGRDKGRLAREIFRDCTTADNWPEWADHHDPIHTISLPRWAA